MCDKTFSANRHSLDIANVRKWRQDATAQDVEDGKAWYRLANEWVDTVVEESGVDARIISAVLAALSPQNKWEQNKVDTRGMVNAYVNGHGIDYVTVSTFGGNKRKAWQFLQGHTWKNGMKTTCFVDNIVNFKTSQRATIDIWAVRVAMNNPDFGLKCEECSVRLEKKTAHGASLTATDYTNIEEMYTEVAKEYGELPLETQAIAWVTMKREAGR